MASPPRPAQTTPEAEFSGTGLCPHLGPLSWMSWGEEEEEACLPRGGPISLLLGTWGWGRLLANTWGPGGPPWERVAVQQAGIAMCSGERALGHPA